MDMRVRPGMQYRLRARTRPCRSRADFGSPSTCQTCDENAGTQRRAVGIASVLALAAGAGGAAFATSSSSPRIPPPRPPVSCRSQRPRMRRWSRALRPMPARQRRSRRRPACPRRSATHRASGMSAGAPSPGIPRPAGASASRSREAPGAAWRRGHSPTSCRSTSSRTTGPGRSTSTALRSTVSPLSPCDSVAGRSRRHLRTTRSPLGPAARRDRGDRGRGDRDHERWHHAIGAIQHRTTGERAGRSPETTDAENPLNSAQRRLLSHVSPVVHPCR